MVRIYHKVLQVPQVTNLAENVEIREDIEQQENYSPFLVIFFVFLFFCFFLVEWFVVEGFNYCYISNSFFFLFIQTYFNFLEVFQIYKLLMTMMRKVVPFFFYDDNEEVMTTTTTIIRR